MRLPLQRFKEMFNENQDCTFHHSCGKLVMNDAENYKKREKSVCHAVEKNVRQRLTSTSAKKDLSATDIRRNNRGFKSLEKCR